MKNNTRNYFSFVLLYMFSTFVYGDNFNQAAVVTAHQIATRTGLEILKKGGNAFDAAAKNHLRLDLNHMAQPLPMTQLSRLRHQRHSRLF